MESLAILPLLNLIALVVLGIRALRGNQPRWKFVIPLAASLGMGLFTFFPFIWALIEYAMSGFQGQLWNDGPHGHATILWLVILTVPLGSLGLMCTTFGSWFLVLRKD